MTAYYNEYDPRAAEWLRELIKAGAIAPGDVDDRSILEVTPNDLKGYTQCHFFAGIGGWSLALRLAGWADSRPVWTGSAPCQPFSSAGKQKGTADDRHLFPVWMRLIRECCPPIIFGEQVEAAIRHGWLDLVSDDLEAEDYACGAICAPACSVGAPHIRQRLWFVAERLADSNGARLERHGRPEQQYDAQGQQEQVGLRAESCKPGGLADPNGKQNNTTDPRGFHAESCSEGRISRLADPNLDGLSEGGEAAAPAGYGNTAGTASGDGGLADATGDRCQRQGQRWPPEEGREPRPEFAGELSAGPERSSDNGGLDDPESVRPRFCDTTNVGQTDAQINIPANTGSCESDKPSRQQPAITSTDAPESIWANPDWLYCRDGKWRPVESGSFPLVNGLPRGMGRMRAILERLGYDSASIKKVLSNASTVIALAGKNRVARLKGYGNAIVPQVAAEIIKTYMEYHER